MSYKWRRPAFLAWSRSLDTTPERLMEILQRGGEGARCVRDLLGIKPAAA